jgi:glycosyltransferase involved in cell wall biosynthesis
MISVLIPIYNTPVEYIKECFDSINKQSFQNFEVIVVNDGSTSDVFQFLDSYNNNPKYKIYHKDHEGISKALNYGLGQCSYNLVARMDADDIMDDNRLFYQYDYMTNNEMDILGSQMRLFGYQLYDTSHPTVVNRSLLNTSNWFLNHPTVMYKKNKIQQIGAYNSNFDGVEDLELWARCLANEYVIYNCPEILVYHRRHSNNSGWAKDHSLTIQQILNHYSKENSPL